MSLVALVLALGIFGQETVNEAAARALVVKRVDPVYPAAARARHVQGVVVLSVKVDPRGHVESVKVVSGPSMLQQAAIDAVRRWVFNPMKQDGVIVTFTTEVTVSFPVKKEAMPVAARPESEPKPAPVADDPVQAQYAALAETCSKLVAARGEPNAQAAACDAAARKADEFATDGRLGERRSAYVYAATAMMRDEKYEAAVAYGEKAVLVVQQAGVAGAGASAAYAVKGQAEAFAGDFAAADRDLAEAEKFERSAVAAPSGKGEAAVLKQLLNLRSQVLRQLGRKDEADQLKAEAEAR